MSRNTSSTFSYYLVQQLQLHNIFTIQIANIKGQSQSSPASREVLDDYMEHGGQMGRGEGEGEGHREG